LRGKKERRLSLSSQKTLLFLFFSPCSLPQCPLCGFVNLEFLTSSSVVLILICVEGGVGTVAGETTTKNEEQESGGRGRKRKKTHWSLFECFLARKRSLAVRQFHHNHHSPVTLVAILKKMAPEKARPATKGQLEESFCCC